MLENQPYAALYCKPFREAIPRMNDIELRAYCYLVTFADSRGVCDPGVRIMTNSGLSATEVSAALAGLVEMGMVQFLRYNERDQITGRMMPNVMVANPKIFGANSDSGMLACLNQFSASEYAQPKTPESNSKNPTPESNSIKPPPPPTPEPSAQAREMPMQKTFEGENSGKAPDYANQNPAPIMRSADNAPSPAAQPQPANAAKNSENDLPPRDTGKLDSYVAPLPQIDKEACAHEMRQLVSGLQLAKARQLVEVYGIEMCMTAIRLLGKQPFKSVDNPPGWIINKLRQGALVPEDAEVAKGRYDGFVQH